MQNKTIEHYGIYELLTRWIQRQRDGKLLEIVAEEIKQDTKERVPYTKNKEAMQTIRSVYGKQLEVVALEE